MFRRLVAALAAVEVFAVGFGALIGVPLHPITNFWEAHNGVWLVLGYLLATFLTLGLCLRLLYAAID